MKQLLTLLLLFTCSFTSIKCSRVKNDNCYKTHKTVVKKQLPCQQLNEALIKYSKQYGIPLKYCYALAYAETRYQGPKHFSYKHNKISSAGARGALQVMPSTANRICKRKVDLDSLKNDINLNVMIAMKLLRRCKDKFGSWDKVFSFYNSGRTEINQYALNIINKEYKWK